MIPTIAECRAGFETGRRFLLGRADAASLLDVTVTGFWRSFMALIPLAPFLAVIYLADEQTMVAAGRLDAESQVDGFYTARILGLLAQWFGYPIVLAGITRLLRVERGFVPYVVAANWSNLFLVPMFAGLEVLGFLGILPRGLIALISFALLFAGFRIVFMIARTTLGVDGLTAFGLVMLGFVFDLGVLVGIENLILN